MLSARLRMPREAGDGLCRLALAARGEADVTLAHAPGVEKKYVEDGKMSNRRLVMYNDFVIIGPSDDPAKIKELPKAVDALKLIAESQSRFVSRGDRSGTHVLELALWKQAGIEPKGAWYIESGQGMGQTLGIANDRRANPQDDLMTALVEAEIADKPAASPKEAARKSMDEITGGSVEISNLKALNKVLRVPLVQLLDAAREQPD